MLEKAEGVLQQVAGGVQNMLGQAIGDVGLQAEGTARRVAGRTEEKVTELLDDARDVTSRNPIGTLTVVAGVAFFLGILWAR